MTADDFDALADFLVAIEHADTRQGRQYSTAFTTDTLRERAVAVVDEPHPTQPPAVPTIARDPTPVRIPVGVLVASKPEEPIADVRRAITEAWMTNSNNYMQDPAVASLGGQPAYIFVHYTPLLGSSPTGQLVPVYLPHFPVTDAFGQ